MNDFYRIYKIMKANKEQRFALATIVRVDGSAYRREGAKMLFGKDGSRYGTISAGCLEEDLSYHVQEVLQSGDPKTVQYDLRTVDDLSWGQSAGCDGNIEVYMEPIHWEQEVAHDRVKIWPHVDRLLNEGKSVICVKCIGGKMERGIQFLYSGDTEITGTESDRQLQTKLKKYVQTFAASGSKTTLYFVPELGSDFLFELYTPKEMLYIFGAGPDAEPLVQLASQVDFSVTVIDPRSGRCNAEYFPTADFTIVDHPETYLASATLPHNSYVLIMTHNFNRDQFILDRLLQSPPYYLGVLGPRRRTERLVRNKALPDFVHSPIGLNIGAEGPEEISISVMAELIQARKQASRQTSYPEYSCFAYADSGGNI
ncbi:XdhC family protein [Paenibacillus beijingensis]|uniref:Xanthine dehydrogenase n=1 Tax=Paenibacillus beijingensis TaxID=1126833 RepID=A0A0D5NME9_9BACL|nr:XdhC family protein [Paenibacillus beijingensis]AJY76147.1 hypothetical protein VN24_18275 [Paenibacillus beijingensis]